MEAKKNKEAMMQDVFAIKPYNLYINTILNVELIIKYPLWELNVVGASSNLICWTTINPKHISISKHSPIILSRKEKKNIQIAPLDLNTKPEYLGILIPFLVALHKILMEFFTPKISVLCLMFENSPHRFENYTTLTYFSITIIFT